MARKKSIQLAATSFRTAADQILDFVEVAGANQTDAHVSWIYNYAIIKLYREFERLVLDCLVGAINNDTGTVSSATGVAFPRHLTDEVCQFLITGTGYFDFKGRPGLIQTLKQFVPETHYLVVIVKKSKYRTSLEQLSSLRNYAAHESAKSKRAALDAVGGSRLSSSGAWLKRSNRMANLVARLKDLAREIEGAAPY